MNASSPRWSRPLVLGSAILLALALALPLSEPDALAQGASAPETATPATPGSSAPPAGVPSKTERPPKLRIEIDTGDAKEVPDEAGRDQAGVRNEKSGKKRVRVRAGLGADRDYDSFGQFVHNEPETAGMVVAIVAIVFLSPALIVALIVGYRMRKARMLNETLVKLVEKGVVAPGDAMQALSRGDLPPAAMAAAGTTPLTEQAQQIRARAAWSDLRKGVLLGAVGLGLALYSMLDDRSPNAIGLILLFVGIGYAVLWWFEARPREQRGSSSTEIRS